jgi:BTB/POZ domain
LNAGDGHVWVNFNPDALLQCTAAYEELWTSKRYTDFTTIAGADNPKKFAVHKSVLGPSSSVFATVFEHDMKHSVVMEVHEKPRCAYKPRRNQFLKKLRNCLQSAVDIETLLRFRNHRQR